MLFNRSSKMPESPQALTMSSVSHMSKLGVAYVEARIYRLQQMGIPPSRPSEVVHLFQTGLQDLLDQSSSRIESIGDVSTPRTTFSTGIRRYRPDQGKDSRVRNDSSVQAKSA
jgi:hypothetical protein